MAASIRGMGIMKKTVVLTMIVLFLFATGCTFPAGKEIYLSHTANITGLYAVYYKDGCITLRFDEKYVRNDDVAYCDFTGLIRDGDQQEKDLLSLYAMTGDGSVFTGSSKTFDSSGLTVSFDIDYTGNDITYILICYKDIQYGLDIIKQKYPELYNIRSVTVEQYCDHVYCPDYLFTEDEKINKCIIDCMESEGKDLKTDVYICDYHYFAPDNSVTLYAYGYVNGAVVEYIAYHANSDDVCKFDEPEFIRDPVTHIPDPVIDPDTTDLSDPGLCFLKAVWYIRNNTDEELYTGDSPVFGRYLLKYDISTDSLYYEFLLCNRILISVDANTLEITDYDPWSSKDQRYLDYWVSTT